MTSIPWAYTHPCINCHGGKDNREGEGREKQNKREINRDLGYLDRRRSGQIIPLEQGRKREREGARKKGRGAAYP